MPFPLPFSLSKPELDKEDPLQCEIHMKQILKEKVRECF